MIELFLLLSSISSLTELRRLREFALRPGAAI
jgi:hypothetical protein